MQYDRAVVGYHGCDERFARAVLHGRKQLKPSVNDYDWLGRGIYFWEYGANRAYEWAKWKAARGEIKTPAVLGALIQLGDCFDGSGSIPERSASRSVSRRFCGGCTPQARTRML
jgi:hypothetical protein